MQAGGELIEFHVAGRDTGDAFAFAEDFFEALEVVADDVLYRDETGVHAVFGEGEDGGRGTVQDRVSTVFAFEGALLDVVRRVDQCGAALFL